MLSLAVELVFGTSAEPILIEIITVMFAELAVSSSCVLIFIENYHF